MNTNFDINRLEWTRKPRRFEIGDDRITFGIYAYSPKDSSFTAASDHVELYECKWPAHDGQAPDEE